MQLKLFKDVIIIKSTYKARYAEDEILEVFRSESRLGLLYQIITGQWVFLDLSQRLKNRKRVYLISPTRKDAEIELTNILNGNYQ